MDQLSVLMKVLDDVTKRTRKKKWPCFYPECNQRSTMSHSQTRSTSLRNIAEENGHVMQRNFNSLPPRPRPGWTKIGIGKATRFPGFCKQHDNALFKKADSVGQHNITPKALSLLSFRTFALEMRKKEIYADQSKRILIHKDNFIDPTAAEYIEGTMEGMKNCLRVTKPYHLNRYHRLIKSKDYAQMRHKIFISDTNLGVSCSTAVNPLYIGQNPLDKPQPLLSFNVLPRRGYTIVVFSYFKEYIPQMEDFITKFQRLENVVFNFCEEVTLRISLFQTLDANTLDIIDRAQATWVNWEPTEVPNIFKFVLKEETLLAEV